MRLTPIVGLLLLVSAAAARAQCNPVCASQPAQCCGIQSDTFLAEECTGVTSDLVHFVVTDGTGWIDQRLPATFDVSGLSGTATLGDVMPTTFSFTIGISSKSARFQVIDSTLTVIGQCVGVSGNTYAGLPTLISEQGRALQVIKQNPLYCREGGALTRDILCLEVRGQVGPPFQAQQLCNPDRVEFACGVVS
jgi:hypothetical protein